MGVVVNPDSEEAKEMAKWEMHPSKWGSPGRPWGSTTSYGVRRPDGSIEQVIGTIGAEFPRMMYKARRRQDGYLCVIDPRTDPDAESWSRQNYQKCSNEAEHTRMLEQGWRDKQEEALKLVHSKEKAISTAAAHRAYEDRNMSEPAKREIAAVEAASPEHVPEKVEAPRQKRKYVRKAKPEAN